MKDETAYPVESYTIVISDVVMKTVIKIKFSHEIIISVLIGLQ